MAEARGVDDHEVGAGADFFDPADAVGGLRVAVELEFDSAGAAREVAGCAAGEGLHEVAEVAFGAELGGGGGGAMVGGGGGGGRVVVLVFGGVDAGVRFAVVVLGGGGGMVVFFEFAEDVGGCGGIFHGWEHGGAFAGGELVELFDVGVVAEAVGPPAGDEVHAIAFHLLQQLPAAIGCAGEFGGFVGFVFGFDGVVGGSY